MTPRHAELARAAAAATALAAALVGVPVLLAVAVGWPLPRALPRLSDLADTFTGERPLEVAVVWKVLAAAVWVAWAQVAAAAVVEVAAVVRGGLPRPLPGLGLGHGLAAPLVAAVVLAWPAGATPRAVAHTVPAVAERPPPAPASSPPDPAPPPPSPPPQPAPAMVDHVVERGDNLWDLAERYLGDGFRAGELFELNRGRPQRDGAALSQPGLLRPGWVLRIPASAPRVPGATGTPVTVRAGDTLWELAEDHLGDAHRYHELSALNAGRPQPDGDALTRPELIEPGWVLDLPQASVGLAPTPPAVSSPPDVVAPEPAVDPTDDVAPAPPATRIDEVSAGPPPSDQAPAERRAPAPPSPAGSAPDASGTGGDDASSATAVAPLGLVAGGVGTAGLLLLVERRRRAQQRRRAPERRLPSPEPPVDEAERALRAGADVDTAALLDASLRAAASGCAGGALPRLRWAEAGAGSVVLVVDDEAPAPPGFVAEGPRRWRTTASVDELASLGQAAACAWPTLVPVGTTTEGAEVLIDLEASAVVTVIGDEAATDALLRAAGASVATSPWADHTRVVVVARHWVSPLAQVEASPCLDDALDELERRADVVAAGLASRRWATTAHARACDPTPDAWTPLVVVATEAPHDRQLRRLAALAERPGCGIGVVVAASASAEPLGRVLEVDADGGLRIDGVDAVLRARRLEDKDVGLVAELLEATERPAVAPAELDQPRPRTPPRAPAGGALDALLGEVDVLVRVLGEVEAVRLSPDGERRLAVPKQKSLEAIAYLALREASVDREDLQAALWPDGANSAKTFHNTIWAARRALGTDRDGAEAFPEPVGGRYTLSSRVVTDYGLAHELISRADELDDPEAAAALLADALRLVRGEPFVGVGRGYAWVAPHSGIIVAQVVDAAEELAEMRLAAGDWRGAEWAARQGLRVFPCEERLYRLLMRCAHAAGSLPGVHRAFQELADTLADPDGGVEPEDTIHPDTVALLEDLTGALRAGRASA